MKIKKVLPFLLAGIMIFSLTACGQKKEDLAGTKDTPVTENTTDNTTDNTEQPKSKIYNVVNLVNGNLGDKSFFDSAQSGLKQLEDAGRITLKTIEMGATDADKPKWEETLNEVSASGEYDVIVCGTYQMNEFLEPAAKAYPDQKYIIYDSEVNAPNVCNINYKQNELGYLIGAVSASLTKAEGVDMINPDNTIGFIGGVDTPVINDFLYGFLLGAQKANSDIKVDTRYISNYYDVAAAKEFALSMIKDKKCDVIWGVAGLAGNGGAEAALETKNAWFVGVDSDQELTLSPELAAVTITSGLKNVGNSIVWFFDELDKGTEHYGELVLLGLKENGVGVVTDKNFDKVLPQETKDLLASLQQEIIDGKIEIPTAIGEEKADGQDKTGLEILRDSLQP